jgi:hypothetical protein
MLKWCLPLGCQPMALSGSFKCSCGSLWREGNRKSWNTNSGTVSDIEITAVTTHSWLRSWKTRIHFQVLSSTVSTHQFLAPGGSEKFRFTGWNWISPLHVFSYFPWCDLDAAFTVCLLKHHIQFLKKIKEIRPPTCQNIFIETRVLPLQLHKFF